MARSARALFVLLTLGVGCASQTIDLLSPPEGTGTGGSSGAPSAGTHAGTAPSFSGAGGRGATGGVGGAAARGGTGFFGGGTGNLGAGGDGGEGGDQNEGGATSTSCMMNSDCPTSEPYCLAIMGTPRFHCRECVQHSDCALGQRCNFLTNECAPACTTFEQCPFSQPFCERGVCIQCQTDSHCGPNVCVFGHCEACRSTLDCPPSAPYCEPDSYTCRPCTGMYQCGNGRYCDLTTGRCEFF